MRQSSSWIRIGVTILLGLLAAGSAVADVSVSGPYFDEATSGDYRGTYGDCFYYVPAATADFLEQPTGPDPFSQEPGQYMPLGCYGGALFDNDPEFSHIDWRLFKGSAPNVSSAFTWRDEADLPGSDGQIWNECLQQQYFSVWDNDRYVNDPLNIELTLGAGGDLTMAYFFTDEVNICRGLAFELYVDEVLSGSGELQDLRGGTYVVFDITGVPETGAVIRLSVVDADGDPICEGPFEQIGLNSTIGGVFINGTTVCAEPFCGDGTVDEGEECDDGNNLDGDGCDANCMVEPFCGDGTVDPGEQCDDGNNVDGDGCDANCMNEPGDFEGCTPGYWKQPQHFDSWVEFMQGQSYSDVFGRVITVRVPDKIRGEMMMGSSVSSSRRGRGSTRLDGPALRSASGPPQRIVTDPTLLQALNALGNDGTVGAFARHSVAALLNASSEVNYDSAYPTVDEVIAAVQAAIDGGTTGAAGTMFAMSNERECPLN